MTGRYTSPLYSEYTIYYIAGGQYGTTTIEAKSLGEAKALAEARFSGPHSSVRKVLLAPMKQQGPSQTEQFMDDVFKKSSPPKPIEKPLQLFADETNRSARQSNFNLQKAPARDPTRYPKYLEKQLAYLIENPSLSVVENRSNNTFDVYLYRRKRIGFVKTAQSTFITEFQAKPEDVLNAFLRQLGITPPDERILIAPTNDDTYQILLQNTGAPLKEIGILRRAELQEEQATYVAEVPLSFIAEQVKETDPASTSTLIGPNATDDKVRGTSKAIIIIGILIILVLLTMANHSGGEKTVPGQHGNNELRNPLQTGSSELQTLRNY